ncbi:MAG: hypothetical protein ACOC7X_03460 [Spirochaetota bacterium]
MGLLLYVSLFAEQGLGEWFGFILRTTPVFAVIGGLFIMMTQMQDSVTDSFEDKERYITHVNEALSSLGYSIKTSSDTKLVYEPNGLSQFILPNVYIDILDDSSVRIEGARSILVNLEKKLTSVERLHKMKKG